ncbi:MAG: hypothetical protein RMM58_01900 [Chloroflexota bacterium]|nr:hypothetical protein [Chloroflexota bacterium]
MRPGRGLLLGLLAAGVVLGLGYRWMGSRAYADAVALQLADRCAEAIPRFQQVVDWYGLFPDLAQPAKQQIDLCEQLVRADTARAAARWRDAVRGYQAAARAAAGQPFEAVLLRRLADIQPEYRSAAEKAYADAVAVQLAGRCLDSFSLFQTVIELYNDFSDLTQSARQQIDICAQVVRADNARNSGRWQEAVRGYQAAARAAAGQPAEVVPLGRLADLQAIAIADSTTLDACRGIGILDAFRAEGVSLSRQAQAAIPTAIFQCGRASDNANNYRLAADMYARLLTDYPSHPNAREARRLRADAEVNDAFSKSTPRHSSLQPSGPGRAGVVTLEIVNDSPEPLEFFFSGPTSDVIVLGPCPTCQTYPLFGPLYCPNRGPRQIITLPPGTYRVLARSRGGTSVTSHHAVWDLASGMWYTNCYVINVWRFGG